MQIGMSIKNERYKLLKDNLLTQMERLKFSVLRNRQMSLLFVIMLLFCFTESKGGTTSKNTPLFSQFSYRGNDRIYKDNPLQADEFYTPILQGCYPDPSITRKGNDFYLVNSSFAFFPGVPIFHSKDLVNWEQIGHVLDRKSQLKLEKSGISAGVYAPDIKYNPYNDTFYMITTEIAGGMGNIVVKTKDPLKGWSDPVKLQFDGIDPSLFFDDNGKAYLVHNDAPPKGEELYTGHRVIKIWEYDLQNDKVIPGTDKIIVNGGTDISEKPIWIEGPHLYKKNGRYYLMCAQGGTGDWHSEVIFIADSPKGPFTPAPSNPILTQRYFAKGRANKVDWTGHADLVEGLDGKYYGVFLGVRPNEKTRVNTGRETYILPVDWDGVFPLFENGLIPLKPKLKMPKGVKNQTGQNGFMPNGNFTFTDDFTSKTLDLRWIGIRGPREDFAGITKDGLILNPFTANIKDAVPTSTLFYRQQHIAFDATVTMRYTPNSEKDLAGIVCYQKESFNYVFGITKKGKDFYLVLQRTDNGKSTLVASEMIDNKKPCKLQVEAQGDNYKFNYSIDGVNFKNLGGTLSGDILSTDVAGGFTGALIGLYATFANDAIVQ
jgi:Beta-xylosidase